MSYIVVNIGCIECGVSSKVVGVFAKKERADAVAEKCDSLHNWRQGGQNNFEVFEIPEAEKIDPEYEGVE